MSTPKNKRILCIDDDAINRMVLKHLLGSMGYEVESAAGGAEGLAILEEKPIDLVLLDIYMPHMDGFETAAAIRTSHSGMPIAFISAGEDQQLAEKMKELVIQHFLPKPIEKDLLAEVLKKLL